MVEHRTSESGNSRKERFSRFHARFEPQRRDDLREGAEDWIGRELEWERVWMISEEDGGPYVGQWACAPVLSLDTPRAELPPFVWVPESDLVEVEP